MRTRTPPSDPDELQAWCERESARVQQAENDRLQRDLAYERARRFWEYGTGYGAECWSENRPILVIVELP